MKNVEKESAGEVPVFVQTAVSDAGLDRWQQITEDEARMVYDMTLRNELPKIPVSGLSRHSEDLGHPACLESGTVSEELECFTFSITHAIIVT